MDLRVGRLWVVERDVLPGAVMAPETPEGSSQFVQAFKMGAETGESMLQLYFHPNASLDDNEMLAELEGVLAGYDDMVQLCESWGWSMR